jgi:hypothetical protein
LANWRWVSPAVSIALRSSLRGSGFLGIA